MKDFFDKIMAWGKANPLIAIGAVLLSAFLFFPKLFRGVRRRRVRRSYRPVIRYNVRRRKTKVAYAPRRRRYTKGGKAKKPWQIKGSPAARRYMARLRRKRG